jgi:hypothetical protein
VNIKDLISLTVNQVGPDKENVRAGLQEFLFRLEELRVGLERIRAVHSGLALVHALTMRDGRCS